jgi:hypothetical protein
MEFQKPKLKPILSKAEVEQLRADIENFLVSAPDSPLDKHAKEQMAKQVAWQRKHGSGNGMA